MEKIGIAVKSTTTLKMFVLYTQMYFRCLAEVKHNTYCFPLKVSHALVLYGVTLAQTETTNDSFHGNVYRYSLFPGDESFTPVLCGKCCHADMHAHTLHSNIVDSCVFILHSFLYYLLCFNLQCCLLLSA